MRASPTSKPEMTAAEKVALSSALPFRRGGAEAGLPQRFKILSWGENTGRTTGAKIIVNEDTLSLLPQYQSALGLDSVVLDYEHQSHPGHPNFKEDPRDVPGHGTIEVIEGEGVFHTALSYTPDGQKHAANYKDVSAVAHLSEEGTLLYVSSVALTQYGDVAGMEFAEHVAALSARYPLAGKPLSNNTTSPTTEKMDNPDYRKMLIELLNIAPDPSGEVSDESIAAALEMKKTSAKMDEALGAEHKDEDKIVSMSAVSALFDERDRRDIIKEATAAGKVIPLSNKAIERMSPADLRDMVDKLPAGEVALSTDGNRDTPRDKPSQTVALSADQAAAAKSLGLTAEEYLAGK